MSLKISNEGCKSSLELSKSNDVNTYTAYSTVATIKITIKDKPFIESKEYHLKILHRAFHSLLCHMKEIKRLNALKVKLQENWNRIQLKRYFHTWKVKIRDEKKSIKQNANHWNLSDEEKIELFVKSIVEKPISSIVTRPNKQASMSNDVKRKIGIIHTVDSAIQKQLDAQKKIINRQNLKLIQQNEIIENMKLEQLANESQREEYHTLTSAKKVLNTCTMKTQYTLRYLVKEGDILKPPKPPKFLLTMEERAEKRRERMRIAREERQRKHQWEAEQQEIARREEEERKKQLQFEEQVRIRRILKEQQTRKAKETQRNQIANDLATSFYRKYLLRHYVMAPFFRIVQEKYNYLQLANHHWASALIRKTFRIWKNFAGHLIHMKMKLSLSIYNKKILNQFFVDWINFTKAEIQIYENSYKYYLIHLRKKSFRIWYNEVCNIKFKYIEDQQWAINYYHNKLYITYFRDWRKYVKISDEIEESDKRKDKWRLLVQQVIPNFCPSYSGVILD